MIDFKEIYEAIYSFDTSLYSGLAVISTAVISVGVVFYAGKKYSIKNPNKDEKSNLEKKVEE